MKIKKSILLAAWIVAVCQWSIAADQAGPVCWWKMDGIANAAAAKDHKNDADHPTVLDAASNIYDPIQGQFQFQAGVADQCLHLDEATTTVVRKASAAPKLDSGAFTVEAWVALQAYPWNWCPIACQQDAEKGFFFGVDSDGRFGLRVSVDGKWQNCYCRPAFPGLDTDAVRGISGWMRARGVKPSAEDRPQPVVPLLVWSHLVGTFDPKVGLTIYRNGHEEGRLAIQGKFTAAKASDLILGRTPQPIQVSHAERPQGSLPTTFSLDGLLDEVKIFDRALSAAEIEAEYHAVKLSTEPPLAFRQLPTGPKGTGPFGAFYTKLKYDDAFDRQSRTGDFADVVVRFDEMPVTVVCWHGINYYPVWYTENGIGTMHEAYETWGKHGCYEAMSDKQCRFSSVKIVESSAARVVLHWRHCLVGIEYDPINVDPQTGWSDWCDDYYTIYPDGLAYRRSVLWSKNAGRGNHSLGGDDFVLPIGRAVWDCFEKQPLTFADLDGKETIVTPQVDYPQYGAEAKDKVVQYYNLKAKHKTFTIFLPGSIHIGTFAGHLPWPWSFPWWNHWPVAQVPSDGRAVWLVDGRPCSTALTQPEFYKSDPRYPKTENSLTLYTLQGITADKTAGQLATVARAWAQPPKMTVAQGKYVCQGYDLGEGCYTLFDMSNSDGPEPVKCAIDASHDHPVANVAMILKRWRSSDMQLEIDGKAIAAGKDFRVAHRNSLEGSDAVVWIKLQSEKPVTITLTPK